MKKNILSLLILLIALFLLWQQGTSHKQKARLIKHTFSYDANRYPEPIRSLAVAGDFNHWNRQTAIPLNDHDGDGIWQATVSLEPGWHEYRFLLNGSRWLRDFANPVYGGRFSNSRIYVDKVPYPQWVDSKPANGSWLYRAPDSLRLFFNRSLIGVGSRLRHLLFFDGAPTSFTVRDSVLISALSSVNDGEHLWRVLLVNAAGDTVCDKSGIFFVNLHNQPPVANAGYLQFYRIAETVRLNGGLSYDPDFEPLTKFQWRQIAGPQKIALKNGHTPFAEFTAAKSGVYTFRLTVTDSLGLTDSDLTRVVVLKSKPDSTLFTFHSSAVPFAMKKVALAGEFNQWNKNRFLLCPNPDSSQWRIRVHFAPGQYEYKFVLNDSLWLPDPANSFRIPDGWQGFNSVIRIPSQDPARPELDRARISERGNQIIVPVNIPKDEDARLRWFSEPHNPDGKFSFTGDRFTFYSANPQGVYFFYALTERGGRYSQPLTIMVRHFARTEIVDFSAAPSWPDTSVVYEVYLRTFSRTGDLRGLMRKLPYLKKLGVNTLWLMPIYEGPTRHGYAPTDLFAVEKDYGTLSDYRRLIRAAHRNGMKIIFDFVANHLSDQHRFVRAAADNLKSPLRRWFYWQPDGRWGYHNDWDTLVNLNYRTPAVRHRILEAARFWVGLGVDGFRCDVAWAVPHDFWKDFRREIKKIDPNILLIDEVLPRQPAFHHDQFDMSYDTDFYGTLLDVMAGKKPVSAFPYNLDKTAFNYPAQTKNLRYLENHDLERFIKRFGPQKTEVAVAILFTIPGTPLIYQGQEFAALQMRPAFPVIPDQNWFDFYQSLIKFRKEHPELTLGTMTTLSAGNGLWRFERSLGEQKTRVIVNLSETQKEINFPNERSTVYIKGNGLIRKGNKSWIKPESFIIYKIREK